MTIGNRFELIDQQSFLGQTLLNIYYFEQVSGLSGNASDLVGAWLGAVLPSILPVQGLGLTHQTIAARNLDLPTDFILAVTPAPNVGTTTGDNLPPFLAWAFRYNRATLAVRNGQKRIGGLSENAQQEGVASATTLTALNTLATVLDSDVPGSGATYRPRIMRKTVDPVTGITTYTAFPLSSVVYVRLSSQNTRKFGRGI